MSTNLRNKYCNFIVFDIVVWQMATKLYTDISIVSSGMWPCITGYLVPSSFRQCNGLVFKGLKRRPLRHLTMLETQQPVVQNHIPGELNLSSS